MGLCEHTRGSWRQAGAGGLRGAGEVMLLMLLLLGLSRAQSVGPQSSCLAATTPQDFTPPKYENTVQEYTAFMAALVQSFLRTVQPHPFPKDLILRIFQKFYQVLSNKALIKEVLLYEVGFLVCLAIGVLYIILMPIVGLFLACCRCYGNCGGKMYQKQESSTQCRRQAFYWSAFVTTCILFAGNVCMFRSNESLKVSVDQSPKDFRTSINNVNIFLTSVPQQIDSVVNESYKTVKEVEGNLHNIGPQLGTEIQKQFKIYLFPALNSVTALDKEVVNINDKLTKLDTSLNQLQSSMDQLQVSVTTAKSLINQTLSKPECIDCNKLNPEVEKITVETSISIPSLKEFQSAVNDVIKINLQSRVNEVKDYFHSIPPRVTNDTKDVIQSSFQQLDDIRNQVSQVANLLPLSLLTNVSVQLESAQAEIDKLLPLIEYAEKIRWGVGVALCSVVFLVVVCNLLGLVLGPLGLTPKEDPTMRSSTADCGGIFLMMGAGFSFLFSWLFMIAVLVLFLLGGNVYTLVCRPWHTGHLLKFLETPGLIPGLNIGANLGLKTNLSISDIYRDCEENRPLWTTLHLYELIDLGNVLNVSKYTDEIQKNFEKTDISLSSVVLLSPEVMNQLGSVSSMAGDFDITPATQQINNVSRISLNSTADELDTLAAAQTNNDIKVELKNEAKELRKIQADIETTVIPQLKKVNSTMKALQSTAENINGTVGKVLRKVGAAQDFLNTNISQIVKTESKKFLDCQLDYFIVFADWANYTITQQVARCGPLAGAVDSVEVILCAYIVESLNAFWFSLGWCMIFFIPSIIFSIKLAKFYRRMKYSDV